MVEKSVAEAIEYSIDNKVFEGKGGSFTVVTYCTFDVIQI